MQSDVEMVRAVTGLAEFFNQRIGQALRRAGHEDLTPSQLLVLLYHDAHCTPASLARRLGVTRQSVQKTLRLLESAGLSRLEPHPSDGRSKQVVLTTAGQNIRDDLDQAIDGFGRRLDACFGTDTMHVVRRVLAEDWHAILTISDQKA